MIMAVDRTTPITVTIVRVRLFFILAGRTVENIHGRVTVPLVPRPLLPSDMLRDDTVSLQGDIFVMRDK